MPTDETAAPQPAVPISSAPSSLPYGRASVRVTAGEVEAVGPDGSPIGRIHVGHGWFITPMAYERMDRDTHWLETQIAQAKTRADSCAQLAEATCAAAAERHSGYSAPTVAAFSVVFLLVGVCLGWLGLLVRRSHPPPVA